MSAKNYTVQQRMAMFAQSTRQNMQMIPKQTVTGGASNMQFLLPKARLLAKIMMDVEADVTLAGKAFTADKFTPYRLLRRVSLDLNNGFSPYVIGGQELAIYNAMRQNPGVIFPQSKDEHGYCYVPETLQVGQNKMKFTVELPVTLNDRDLIGMVLLQSSETSVTLSVDICNGNEVVNNAEGITVTIDKVTVAPMTITYSIPAVSEAFPDLSVLKLVNSRTDSFAGSGQNVVKLATGTIYRKLALYVTDENGQPFEDADFNSSIELVFNQADVNYSVRAENLRHMNEFEYGYAMPKGVYIFDFSNNGIPNYGGTRDLIDTALLSEFWLRFNSQKRGKVSVISECIARLV